MPAAWLFTADVAAGALGCAGLWLRRRWPVGLAVVLAVFSTFSEVVSGALVVATLTVAIHRPPRTTAAVFGLTMLTGLIFVVVRPEPGIPAWLLFMIGLAVQSAAVGWGLFIHFRRQLVLSLRDRATRAETEAQLRAEQAQQRARDEIAREMHDVLGHRLSLLSVHAGALEFRPDAPAEEVARAAKVIRENAHQALQDLREVIGVLRAPVGELPQPTLADVRQLVAESGRAGMRVSLRDDTGGPVPDLAGRTAYRVVQEALTNARKHAPGAEVRVHLAGSPGAGLTVEVRNDAPPARVRPRHLHGPARSRHGARPRARASRRARARAGCRAGAGRAGRAGRHGQRAAGARADRRGRLAPLGMATLAGMTAPEPDPETVGVLVVDDDPLVRAGLVMMLGGAPDLRVVGEAGDGTQALSMVDRHAPGVVLMDIRMPNMDGLAATEALRARRNAPEVIILTTFDADEHVLRALRAGAAGFVLKDTPPAEIVDAVRRVAKGLPVLSPAVTRRLIARVAGSGHDRRTRARERLALLNDREREVAVAVGQGRSNAEIGSVLYLSVPTVKTHVSSILTKLDLNNRVQIALLAHDAGLLDDPE